MDRGAQVPLSRPDSGGSSCEGLGAARLPFEVWLVRVASTLGGGRALCCLGLGSSPKLQRLDSGVKH